MGQLSIKILVQITRILMNKTITQKVIFTYRSVRSSTYREYPMPGYIGNLEKIVNLISELVISNMKFFLLKNENPKKNAIIATMLSLPELKQSINEFRIYKNWDADAFIEWINKIKDIKVFKITVNVVQIEDY